MLKDMFNRDSSLSFEAFPPKKEADFSDCYKILDSLSTLSPDFISVTYGAGGSNSKKNPFQNATYHDDSWQRSIDIYT